VQSGADTQVWLDRDAGGALAPALVATLQNVTATAVVTASQLLLGEEERAAAASPNHAPTGSDAVIPATEDTPAAGSLPPATDDDGDTVSYAKASDPAHGTVAITPQGGYTYTPAANYSGSDSFTYTLSDGHDGSATYTASVTVAAVNDAPGLTTPAALVFNDTAANDIYLLEFNGSLSGSDVDAGAVLTYSLSGGTPADGGSARTGAYGTLGLNAATGAWTFFPDNAAIQALRSTASDTFTVNVSDGSLGASATFTVQVNGVNDTPAWGTALADQSARQGVAFSAQVPAASVTDRDSGDTLSWSASLASGQPLPAWLGFDAASRTFSGTPGASDLTALELRVTATDSGGAGASDTFALTVAANQVVSGSGDSETLVLPLGSGTVNAGAGVDTVALPMFPNVFSLTENAPGRVSGGYAGYSLDLNDVEYVRFGTTFQTTLAISALVNGTAQTQLGRLTDLYLAFFGRAPDVGGLEYWQRVLLQDGADFASISADFAWSTEAQALFPQGGSNKAFVRTVYLNCFGREPDTLGWDWWTAKLDELDPNDPQYLNNRGSFVGEVILGAYAPTSGDTDRNLLTNRHEASMYYANKLSVQPAEGFDAAINALLTHVTDSAVTEDKAEHVIDHVFADPVTLSGVMTDNALFNSLWGA
jgi:VCBS repeat-containing protein